MESNAAYEGSLSLRSIRSVTEDVGNSPHEDLSNRYLSADILNLSANCLSGDNEGQIKEALNKHQPKALLMDYNRFTTLPDSIPRPSLEVISIASQYDERKSSMDRTPIFQMIPETISRASNLTDLLVSRNGLSHLPSTFIHLEKLTRVDFMSNRFREFPPQLLHLPALRELNLTGNYISEIPSDIRGLQQLESLRIANNELRKLPRELGYLKMLKNLSVRNNHIGYLPSELHRCSMLEELKVSGNPLTYPPQSICDEGIKVILEYLKQNPPPRTTGTPDTLEEYKACLDVSKQGQHKLVLPENSHKNWIVIDARKNEISELPNFPEGLKVASILLDENELVKFPLDPLTRLHQLQTLSLRGQVNKNGEYLMIVPDDIYQLRQLKELFLGQNKIAFLPDHMFFLPSLKVLDLSENKLTSIPAMIKVSQQLEVLDLSKNAIDNLPLELAQLTKLKVLSASNNKLTEFPEPLCELRNLQTLSLHSNCLQRLPLSLTKLTKLISEAEHKITGKTFTSGCMLHNNPHLVFPAPNVIARGIQAIFNDLKFWQDYPHLYEQELTSGHHSRRGRSAVADHILTDDFLSWLSMRIGTQWRDVGRKLGLEELTGPLGSQENSCFRMLKTWRNTGKNREEVMLGKLAMALDAVNLGEVAAEVRAKTTSEP